MVVTYKNVQFHLKSLYPRQRSIFKSGIQTLKEDRNHLVKCGCHILHTSMCIQYLKGFNHSHFLSQGQMPLHGWMYVYESQDGGKPPTQQSSTWESGCQSESYTLCIPESQQNSSLLRHIKGKMTWGWSLPALSVWQSLFGPLHPIARAICYVWPFKGQRNMTGVVNIWGSPRGFWRYRSYLQFWRLPVCYL